LAAVLLVLVSDEYAGEYAAKLQLEGCIFHWMITHRTLSEAYLNAELYPQI
jgi:hypothetical protein